MYGAHRMVSRNAKWSARRTRRKSQGWKMRTNKWNTCWWDGMKKSQHWTRRYACLDFLFLFFNLRSQNCLLMAIRLYLHKTTVMFWFVLCDKPWNVTWNVLTCLLYCSLIYSEQYLLYTWFGFHQIQCLTLSKGSFSHSSYWESYHCSNTSRIAQIFCY